MRDTSKYLVDTLQLTALPYDLLQKRIRDTLVAFPQESVSILDRVVEFVFGECEPIPDRRFSAVGNPARFGLVTALLFSE